MLSHSPDGPNNWGWTKATVGASHVWQGPSSTASPGSRELNQKRSRGWHCGTVGNTGIPCACQFMSWLLFHFQCSSLLMGWGKQHKIPKPPNGRPQIKLLAHVFTLAQPWLLLLLIRSWRAGREHPSLSQGVAKPIALHCQALRWNILNHITCKPLHLQYCSFCLWQVRLKNAIIPNK